MTRLADLHPELRGTVERGYLRFDCPYRGHTHSVGVHIHSAPAVMLNGVKYWHAEGTFPDSLTITPSIDLDGPSRERGGEPCWHGWITNGEVRR